MSAATEKKHLYVGTDKHRWWKEAVVYQVRSATDRHLSLYSPHTRSTPPHFSTATVMAGAMYPASHPSWTTSKT